MSKKHALLALITTLLSCLLLSACAFSADSAFPLPSTPSMAVTPIDTSAGTLDAVVQINENQDATDGMSDIVVQFGTRLIQEGNYVIFGHQEKVTCNSGASVQALNDSPSYSFKVKRGSYTCAYAGSAQGVGRLASVLMFAVQARSILAPQQLQTGESTYKVSYTRDSGDLACQITGEATDGVGNDIIGSTSTSMLGIYAGTPTANLSGDGQITLIRTCHWPHVHDAFDNIDLTYTSTASVNVTWSH